MDFLVDSNILLRLSDPVSPQYQLAFDSMMKLRGRGNHLCVVPQNIYEFWSAATRPVSANGLGLSLAEVQQEVAAIKSSFDLLDEPTTVFSEWEKFVRIHAVIGKNAHDTHLVAAMTVHNITHLLTFNKQDFQRFTNITAMTPADVLALP
jgi:predicted nucleic acid-binding protein